MSCDPDKHHRKSVRLPEWDYATAAFYSVTICVQDRRQVFGEVINDTVRLSAASNVANGCWAEIPEHQPRVVIDAFVVMPNHIHGLVGLRGLAPERMEGSILRCPGPGSLGTVVGTYKAAVTRHLRRSGHPDFRWQRGFHEHVGRSERTLDRLRRYIAENPQRWGVDEEKPSHHPADAMIRFANKGD